MFTTFAYDPDVFARSSGRAIVCGGSRRPCADERLFSRMTELARDAQALQMPGPDREQLLSLLAASPAPA